MKKVISKFELFQALATGSALPSLGLVIVNGIEREDGSNQNYLVTGYNLKKEKVTIYTCAN